jgi:carbon storage regulator
MEIERKIGDAARDASGRWEIMLVMTRKVGETIVIGDHVLITVVLIGGNSVRVGIEAPAEYTVMRRELLDANVAGPRNDTAVDAPRDRSE